MESEPLATLSFVLVLLPKNVLVFFRPHPVPLLMPKASLRERRGDKIPSPLRGRLGWGLLNRIPTHDKILNRRLMSPWLRDYCLESALDRGSQRMVYQPARS